MSESVHISKVPALERHLPLHLGALLSDILFVGQLSQGSSRFRLADHTSNKRQTVLRNIDGVWEVVRPFGRSSIGEGLEASQ